MLPYGCIEVLIVEGKFQPFINARGNGIHCGNTGADLPLWIQFCDRHKKTDKAKCRKHIRNYIVRFKKKVDLKKKCRSQQCERNIDASLCKAYIARQYLIVIFFAQRGNEFAVFSQERKVTLDKNEPSYARDKCEHYPDLAEKPYELIPVE